MKNQRHIFALLVVCMWWVSIANAQELRCNVAVNSQPITNVDQTVFAAMQQQILEFMNARTWTQETYGIEERIDCSIVINLESSPAQDAYKATAIISSTRPVYNSGYVTTVMNFIDKDWLFTYVQNQPIEFNINTFNGNLSSMLAFYAYLIIGLDAESFSKGGGAKYFSIAENIMNLVPNNSPEAKGWRPFDGIRNRYWIVNNLLGGKYDNFKEAVFTYHFEGMDQFHDKPDVARAKITSAINSLEVIARDNPNNVLLNMFMQAKSDELANIFTGAPQSEKAKAVITLRKIDPSNVQKYDQILKSN